jgi:hypothetical protein
VIVPTRVAPAEAITSHSVVDAPALDVMIAKAGGGGMWVGASGAKLEVATIDAVTNFFFHQRG